MFYNHVPADNLFHREKRKILAALPMKKVVATIEKISRSRGPWRFFLHHDDQTVIQ
jgi:hypothetical protein